MIALSNGHSFEYMAASGALGYDGKGWPWEKPLRYFGLLDPGLFTVVMKTITLDPRKGNFAWHRPLRAVRFISGGVVNAFGLGNPGLRWWCREIGPRVESGKLNLVGSVFGSPVELKEMAKVLNDFDLVALEHNASCPNAGTDALVNAGNVIAGTEVIAEVSRHPQIVKLSVVHDAAFILKRISGMAEALSINSVPWRVVFPEAESPLAAHGDGGVSGKAAQLYTWSFMKKLIRLTPVPVIGPGVWEYRDMESVRRLGAKAVSFGSVFLRYPWRPTLFVKKEKHALR